MWDKIKGERDNLGMLNLLTPENTKEALKEIKSGKRVSLDWPLDNVKYPGFGRKEFEQNILDLSAGGFYGRPFLEYV